MRKAHFTRYWSDWLCGAALFALLLGAGIVAELNQPAKRKTCESIEVVGCKCYRCECDESKGCEAVQAAEERARANCGVTP